MYLKVVFKLKVVFNLKGVSNVKGVLKLQGVLAYLKRSHRIFELYLQIRFSLLRSSPDIYDESAFHLLILNKPELNKFLRRIRREETFMKLNFRPTQFKRSTERCKILLSTLALL